MIKVEFVRGKETQVTEISSRIFFHLSRYELKQIKLMLRSHEGFHQVKNALIDFLAMWNGKEWVDWERIDLVFRDLNHTSFWRMLPYEQFLVEAESKVSNEILEILRKIPN